MYKLRESALLITATPIMESVSLITKVLALLTNIVKEIGVERKNAGQDVLVATTKALAQVGKHYTKNIKPFIQEKPANLVKMDNHTKENV